MSFVVGLLHLNNDCNFQCPCKGTKMSWSIWAAAQYGDLLAVATKIAARADLVNLEDEYGYTPLHFAAQHGHIPVVEYLIRKGANVNASKCGASPLHRAGMIA
jgi:ankyrin repeat protein